MNKKNIAVLTATRAEYGLLKPLMERIEQDQELELAVLVTGMHLSEEFGYTYEEIIEDGFSITAKIPILDQKHDAAATSRAMAVALLEFGKYFQINKPDLLVVLGDRYETVAVCLAAVNMRIPIAHIHGGEITEGAVDDVFRHAITKFSYLHFPSTERYAKRIVQLGESPDRVFTVGSLGVENIKNVRLLTQEELEASVGMDLKGQYAVVTFHPVTLEEGSVEDQFREVLYALDAFQMKYIITKANADTGGYIINQLIDEYAAEHDNVLAVTSLGMKRYLSALKYCTMVIGNSSSGILEAPSFGVPTVDIGDRQRGRVAAETVIHCKTKKEEIKEAIYKALEMTIYSGGGVSARNPYDMDGTSMKILSACKKFLLEDQIDLKKKFYDFPLRE